MNYEETNYIDSIMDGLNEAVEYSKGNLSDIKKRTVSISPIPQYSATKIKKIIESNPNDF